MRKWEEGDAHAEVLSSVDRHLCALTKLLTATEMAKSMSSARTYSRRDIRALASAMRIMLSRCRTVIGKEPVAADSRRRSAKSRESFSESRSYNFGHTRSRAYMMYLRSRSCGISWHGDVSSQKNSMDLSLPQRRVWYQHPSHRALHQTLDDSADDCRRQNAQEARPARGLLYL